MFRKIMMENLLENNAVKLEHTPKKIPESLKVEQV